jgi:hypothetical protein
MNKKIRSLLVIGILGSMLTLMPSGSSIVALSNKESKVRLEELHAMQKINNITNAQYVEYGVNRDAIIDRDIALVESDNQVTQASIDSNKGAFNRTIIPGFSKIMLFMSGGLSLGLGIPAGVIGYITHGIWNNHPMVDAKLAFYDGVWLKGSYPGFTDKFADGAELYFQKYAYLCSLTDLQGRLTSDAQFMQEIAPLGVIAGGAAIVCGLIAIPFLYKLYGRTQKNDLLLKELEKRFDRNQQIITRLKEIKYQEIR